MNWTLIIITLIIGIILLVLEIVALPGMIAGTFGVGLTVFANWATFTYYGTKAGTIVLLISMATIAILLGALIKTKTWKRFSIDDQSDSTVNQINNTISIGATGTTIARLAPTGKALINGEQVEVHAINKFIDPDRPIQVVAVDGYRIDVKEVEDNRF